MTEESQEKVPLVPSPKSCVTSDKSLSLSELLCTSVPSSTQKEWKLYPRVATRIQLNEMVPVEALGSGSSWWTLSWHPSS